jgi:hypothetical protein
MGNVVFDQLRIWNFVHEVLSGLHALVMRKGMARQVLLSIA